MVELWKPRGHPKQDWMQPRFYWSESDSTLFMLTIIHSLHATKEQLHRLPKKYEDWFYVPRIEPKNCDAALSLGSKFVKIKKQFLSPKKTRAAKIAHIKWVSTLKE